MGKICYFLKFTFNKAFCYYKEGKFLDAKDIISETKNFWYNKRESYKFITLLALIYIKFNEVIIAERLLIEALALSPGNIKILGLLGDIYLKQKRYREAEDLYKKVKREDLYNFYISLKLAEIAMLLNDYDKMIKILRKGYIKDFIGEKEENKLKKFLINFLKNISYNNCFYIIEDFRKWCEKKKKLKIMYNKFIKIF